MKPFQIILVVLPLVFLAASTRHQAFGPIRFGMSRAEYDKIITKLMNDPVHLKTDGEFTLAEVRNHFVNSGTKRPLTLTPVDAALKIGVVPNGAPGITSFSIERWENSVDRARQTWQLFRDVSDAKFDRNGPKGEFPSTPDLVAAGPKGLVTDKWECDGLQIDLRLIYINATKFDPITVKVGPNDGYFIEPRLTTNEKPASE
jgi:hypothetical protein